MTIECEDYENRLPSRLRNSALRTRGSGSSRPRVQTHPSSLAYIRDEGSTNLTAGWTLGLDEAFEFLIIH